MAKKQSFEVELAFSILSHAASQPKENRCSCRDPRHKEEGCTRIVHFPAACCVACQIRGCINKYGLPPNKD